MSIVTPLAIDEFNGVRGEFYKNMFAKCPAHRLGTAVEVPAENGSTEWCEPVSDKDYEKAVK